MEEIERDQLRMAKWVREFKVEFSTACTGSAFEIRHLDSRGGCSSVGRAVALQAIGREFESPQLHQLPNAECGFGNADCVCNSALRTQHSALGTGV